MDDQRVDREGSVGLTGRLPRVQIGLRLMLLLVALFCVSVACYPPLSTLRREWMKERLHAIEGQARGMEFAEPYYGSRSAKRTAELARLKAEVAEQRRALGEK